MYKVQYATCDVRRAICVAVSLVAASVVSHASWKVSRISRHRRSIGSVFLAKPGHSWWYFQRELASEPQRKTQKTIIAGKPSSLDRCEKNASICSYRIKTFEKSSCDMFSQNSVFVDLLMPVARISSRCTQRNLTTILLSCKVITTERYARWGYFAL
jgi:hypothetical protein